MRKVSLIALVLLTAFIGAGYAQQTAAPDQPAVVVDTNNGQTNVSLQLGSTADTTNIATSEKEVTAIAGAVYNDGKIDYASADVKFVINAKDEGSGVKQVWVMVDDSQFGIYDKPVAFFTEGKHLIGYKAEDNVENISPFKSYEFILDKTAPEVTITSDKKVVKIGDVVYIGSNYNFGISAQDALSGVKSIEYAMDDGATNAYDKPFVAVGTNGFHTIVYKATDNVGNASEDKKYVFFMDANAPTVDFVVDPAVFETNGVKYVSSYAKIKLTAKDAETAVAKIVYTIDGGDEKDYTYPIRLSGGAHVIKAKSYDLVGNVSEEKTLDVTVDAVLPEADLVPTK